MERHPPDEKALVLKRLAAVREANAAAPFQIPITDSFDLHSFLPRDVADVLADYLAEARARGFREVRVIHGKGTGVRRAEVRRLLAQNGAVADFFDAPPERGGAGATVVLLDLR